VRFLFVDRIIAVDPGRTIETLKNVSATEDMFDDHFPGHPIFPGALVVETFEQASQLLIGITHDFASVGMLRRVRHAAFRQFVRPGDQLHVRCERAGDDGTAWSVSATAAVDGRRVASATLDFALVPAVDEHTAHAGRVRETVRVLRAAPIEATGRRGSA
jgi:3-hydroxyacyl-[acyl-carrier-protein] dehydratase